MCPFRECTDGFQVPDPAQNVPGLIHGHSLREDSVFPPGLRVHWIISGVGVREWQGYFSVRGLRLHGHIAFAQVFYTLRLTLTYGLPDDEIKGKAWSKQELEDDPGMIIVLHNHDHLDSG